MKRRDILLINSLVIVASFSLFAIISCSRDVDTEPVIIDNGYDEGIVVDVDGNEYRTVIIGNYEWMAENLKTTRYKNGTPIINPKLPPEWESNTNGAYVFYENAIINKDHYGALYNWYAVINSDGLCPEGWRVPSDVEWTELINYLRNNYENINSSNVGNRLKSCRQVNSPLGGDCDTNDHPRWAADDINFGRDPFGFSALPGGYRKHNGQFRQIGLYCGLWSSTEKSSSYARYRSIKHSWGVVNRLDYFKEFGFSVRCLRDNE